MPGDGLASGEAVPSTTGGCSAGDQDKEKQEERPSGLPVAERCKSLLAANWRAQLTTVRADAQSSAEDDSPDASPAAMAREKLHGSLVRYIVVDGSPIVALLPDDPHHVNLLMDDRASLTVGGTDPPPLIRSLLTSGQMPPRVALLGELVAVDSSETPFILRRFAAKAEAATAAVARLEAALPSPPSSPLPCPPPLSQTGVAGGGGGGEVEEGALTFFRMEARSCQLVDFRGKRTSLPVADIKPAATDPLATSLLPLLLALNSSAASRAALASFCEAFLQVPARPQTTFLFSADRRGFNLLSQSLQPPQQQHVEESSQSGKPQWREFRFEFQREVTDAKGFMQVVREMEEEVKAEVGK
ncbi:hypothetical protein CLOP_g5051 [Closterium sp. NIES-67]|nr:hypothetical protein CLOP_g5051 [Closterium sp. NIES-67]